MRSPTATASRCPRRRSRRRSSSRGSWPSCFAATASGQIYRLVESYTSSGLWQVCGADHGRGTAGAHHRQDACRGNASTHAGDNTPRGGGVNCRTPHCCNSGHGTHPNNCRRRRYFCSAAGCSGCNSHGCFSAGSRASSPPCRASATATASVPSAASCNSCKGAGLIESIHDTGQCAATASLRTGRAGR